MYHNKKNSQVLTRKLLKSLTVYKLILTLSNNLVVMKKIIDGVVLVKEEVEVGGWIQCVLFLGIWFALLV